MQFIPLIAATTESAAHSHSILDALPHLAGMAMVMITLTFLWGVCAFTAKMVSVLTPAPQPAVAPVAKSTATAPSQVAAAPVATGIAPEIVAVIAAAVATSTGQACRIISIKPMSTSWEKAGRHSVLTSHRIR